MVTPASQARLLAGVGRLRDAETAVRSGLIDHPADPELLALLAGLLRLQGRHPDALAAADAAVSAGPGLAITHIERAECLLTPGRDGASPPPESHRDRAPGRFRLGRARADQSHLTEALAEAEQAVRLDPTHPQAYRVLARTQTLRRDFGRARDAARRAVALAPGSVTDLLTLAEVERHAGHRDAAREAVREALSLDPANPDARWLISLLEAERLRVRSAMTGLRALAADHPSRLDATAMTWPIRGLLGGVRRGLTAGLLLTGTLATLAIPWPAALLPARAAAITVALVLILFSARVLIPAGRLPWRCLALLPTRTRHAVLAGLVTAVASVTLLFWYALTAAVSPLLLAALTVATLLLMARADRP